MDCNMANLYPNTIINCKSNAEIKIFNIFKTFSNDFHIIHSLPWLSRITANKRGRYTPEGEIDFVILHKKYGVLCLEIKGGRITYREHAYFTNGQNEIKNPYEQVRENNHFLRPIVDNILIGYAVGFPDSVKPNLIDDQQDITFDINDLDYLENKIVSIYNYWKLSIRKREPNQADIESILKKLLPTSIDELNQKIIYDDKTWLTPSKEQSNIIEQGIKENKFYTSGRAGTGKTILAIMMARILLNKNLKILFLTYNKPINEYIQQQFDSKNIDILTFHKFLSTHLPDENVIQNEFKHLQYIMGNIDNKYDILIIDEAQSFAIVWLNKLNEYFNNKKIYIFADALQSFSNEGEISDDDMDKIFDFQSNKKILTKNYRSPRKVYERLLEMFSSTIQQVSPRNLDELDLVEKITENPKKLLYKSIDSLLEEGISKDDIIILISSKEKNNLVLYEYKNITVETVQRYRGMEKPIVIYVIKSADKNDLKELYVAYSRSTTQTIVIIPEIVLDIGRSHLKKILMDSDFTDIHIKDEITLKEKEFNKTLDLEYPNILKLKNIEIRYSDRYFLFTNKQYKFLNTLLQNYFLKNEICFLELNDYIQTQAIFYFNESENLNLELDLCDRCASKTYFSDNFCLKCNQNEFKKIDREKIEKNINIVLNPEKYPNEIKNQLNDSLKSIGRIFFVFKNKKIKLTDDTLDLLDHRNVMCISCTIEILILLVNIQDEIISLEEIRKGIKKLNGLNSNNLNERTGVYVNRFITHKLLSKVDDNNKKYKIDRNKIFSYS